MLGAGEIDEEEFLRRAADSRALARPLQHDGHGLDDERGRRGARHVPARQRRDPGALSRARPDGLRDRPPRSVDIAYEDLRPSRILTREAFLNAIRTVAAIGGSTNAQPHIVAMARHAGVEIGAATTGCDHGYDLPLLVNMQPAGQYLSERFHRAGGVPAVMWELLKAGRLDGDALTVTGRSQAENLAGREATDRDVILPFDEPLQATAPASSS